MTTDINVTIANLIEDLAEIQTAKQSQMGYRRAAHAILLLEQQVTDLTPPGGELPKIPGVGPKSLRVVEEVLATGRSATVEELVEASGKTAAIARRRELRKNFLSRARVLATIADDTLPGPRRGDYHADLQMHSEWSDGKTTVATMARACLDRGYQFAAMTDHGPALPTAGGLTPESLARQRAEIDAVNRELGDRFCLLAGVEANIALDGTLDLTPEDRRSIDLVVAAAHSGLRLPDDQTRRMTTAVLTPGVHILGHPRGRQRGHREGILADWDSVFGAAAKARVAIEIDGDPARQDVDYELARRAADLGCIFALDSDAHQPQELGYADIALAHAKLAAIPTDRIVNCWPLGRFLDWLADRSPRG